MNDNKFLYGNMETQIKKPILKYEIETKGWWIFKRSVAVYYIELEFCRLGPYYNYAEALEHLSIAQW